MQKLCRLIIESDLNINFSTNTRADTLDYETLQLMKKAGCNLISIGIESASQELLDKMGKKTTIEQIKKAVSMIKEAKIMTYAYYVLGLPWETKETIEKTYSFAKELNTEFASFYTAAALIGTKFYNYAEKNRLGEINYEKPYVFPCVRSYELSAQELFEYNKKFNKNYYLRARYILKMVSKIDSIAKFKSYYDAFLKLVKKC